MYDEGAGTELGGNAVGNVRKLEGIRSPELRNERDVFVYLPPSYAASGRHYPAIYMHDGQNLFDDDLSFAGAWHVDETMERLAAEGIEAIVVGVANIADARLDEYSPYTDPKLGGGRGRQYVRFLVETLKPQVDAQFRTRREAGATAIAGSSMGGLISLFALLHRPDVFGAAAAMSPSLWFASEAMLETVRAMDRWTGRLYLDIGTGEGRPHVRRTRELARLLRARTPHPRRQIRYLEARDAGHNEAAWAERFERAVRWLLPKPRTALNW
jgi:predicted alpha/beta superfamily hydrolase